MFSHLLTWLSPSAAACRERKFLYVCVRTGRPIKHIGPQDGALCREGQPKKTSKFFGRVCVFRAPDLVSPHNSASAAYQSVSQLKMAFVLQSQQTGAGWPAAVILGRQQEALFVMTSILRDDYGKNPQMSFASVLIRMSIIGTGR